MTIAGQKTKKLNQKLQAWIEARQRHRLSHAQVQMARELGMNPATLGKTAPDNVMSIEERSRHEQQRKEARRVAR